MVTGYRSSSPESILSEIDLQTDAFDDSVIDLRRTSPESIISVNENRPLSPDSPVPEFTQSSDSFVMPELGSRPTSSESVCLDDENEFCLSDLNLEQRPDSPKSISSEAEGRPLSPDSPVPQFCAFFPQSAFRVTGHRSCSPQSICSETTDYEPSFADPFTLEHRPDSPDSILSDTDERPLSTDSFPDWRPMSPESAMLLADIRRSSPQSVGSINECRPLSTDSPVPQYFAAVFESIPVTDYRSSSPESVWSEEEYELNVFSSVSSPEPTEYISGHRFVFSSLSPDSPIPQFYASHFEPIMVTGYRSSSPESILSEIDLQTDAFDDSVIDLRRTSPESIISVNENRPLSPDSPVPEFTPSSDSFVMPELGSRSTSSESVCLDDENEFCLSDLNPEQRPDSPKSISSEAEGRPLSPDSPVPQFCAFFPQSAFRETGHRSCSPQLICSETTDYEPCFADPFTLEHRPDSPDSILSDTDERPLSTDSFPDWRPMSPEFAMLLADIRGSSPQSVGSINECRPLSTDSPVPQYFAAVFESIPVTDYRSSSPESVWSEEEYELNVFSSVSSLEPTEYISGHRFVFRSLSPDSPIPQYYASHFEPIMVTGYRSSSPESILSEIDLQTDAFVDSLIDLRRTSPESIISVNKNRKLSPDSPVPEFTPSSDSFVMPELCSRSTSPESVCLDDENEFCLSDLNPEQRPDSPKSISSEVEGRPLSPDSPVPQFCAFFPQSALRVTGHRSCSPQSICSETTDYEPSFADPFALEHRPDSPDSILSDIDERPCSTDSFPDWRPMSPESAMLLADIRGSSPQSVGSINECRPLSTDSPVPQYFAAVFESSPLIGYRSTSPASVLLEEEYELNDFSSALSPDPTEYISEDGFVFRSLSPDSPIPQYYTSHFEPIMVTGYRSSSPESILSEIYLQTDAFDDSVIDLRRSSPCSIISVNENRPLSPDSLVPELTPSTHTFIMPKSGSRSTSSESESLDDENECCLYGHISEQRLDSPQSMTSEIKYRPLSPDSISDYRPMSPHTIAVIDCASPESFMSLEECGPLSPDSPVPQFSCSHEIASLNIYRSKSSESLTSEADIELWVFGSQATDQRPSSPNSVISLNENSKLSPDSPISDFKSLICVNVTQGATCRSSSLESIASDEEFDMASFVSEDITTAENRPLFPDSGELSPVDRYCLQIENKQTAYPSQQSLHDQKVSETVTHLSLHETLRMVPQYKLVYKTVPLALISQLYDPQYKGETFCLKPGVFEYAGCRMEIMTPLSSPEIPLNYESTLQSDTEIPNRVISGSEKTSFSHAIMQTARTVSQESHVQAESFDLFVENRALSPDSLSEYTTLFECLMKISDSRASSPESFTSVNEYRQLSPDSPILVHRPLLTGAEFYAESRPSSPETIFSVNEFQRLSPDSPIPEYSTPSPVPNEHRSETKPLSLLQFNGQSSDLGSVDPEYWSSWRPLPEWTVFEPRPLSTLSNISDTYSLSLSPQSFYFESELRYPSPEAATLETELTETISPEPLIFESVTFEPEYEEYADNVSQLSIPDSEGIKEDDVSLSKNDAALLNQVTFEQCSAQTKSLSKIVATETFPETKIKSQSKVEIKPKSLDERASEPRPEETKSATKEITYRLEKDAYMATAASASEGTSEGQVILKRDERHMESPQQHEEELEHESTKLAPQESQERESASNKAIHLEPQETDLGVRQGDASSMISKITAFSEENSLDHTITTHDSKMISLEHQQKLIASSLTSESSKESDPRVTTMIPEEIFAFDARKSNVSPHPLPKEPRASTGSQELHSFQFHLQESHRRVTPNLTASSQLSLSLKSPDYRHLLSGSINIPSTGIQVSPTDLSPISHVYSTSSSDQELSPLSRESAAGIFQVSPGFKYALSEFEQTLSSFGGKKPESNLVFPGTYPLVAAMTPRSLEVTQELKASKLPTRLTDDQKQLDASTVIDVDSPLYSVNLKARPRLVHADSTDVESDVEFFDCCQTFSDTSEPELGSAELLDVPQTVYQVEEPPSLPSSPEYLTGITKLREYAQLKKDDRPLSWGSEDLDLPLVLEPEDEYTGEEKAYAYGYAGDHSFAEELPPREGAQYDDDDDDDDSLGRVSCLA
ncbi:uncharacterized protein LOC127454015 [Myxocyprinus asiaticus]|uniref:uncharacterized protein LOC127454015 n=1 Tax=Myxocyprinus asiaticus TaxID=70543 RepID=UPI0022222D56|nr:uncharacterized protein LOC127454015 [Myxocyprinus asiaticus]